MAIKTFKFDYDYAEAGAVFKVDTNVFTSDLAKENLQFFTWDYDEDGDPVTEILKKYAMEAIRVATNNSFNIKGVVSDFNNKEGFVKLDGTVGLTLVSVRGYEFDDAKLDFEVI
jgi:hypothetical protein